MPVGNRQRALTRLFDYYLAASVTATDLSVSSTGRPEARAP